MRIDLYSVPGLVGCMRDRRGQFYLLLSDHFPEPPVYLADDSYDYDDPYLIADVLTRFESESHFRVLAA